MSGAEDRRRKWAEAAIAFVGAELRAAEARSADARDTFDTDLALVLEAWLVAMVEGREGPGWKALANAARRYLETQAASAEAKGTTPTRVSSRRMLRPGEQLVALRAFAAQLLSADWSKSVDAARGLAGRIDDAVGAVLPGHGGIERAIDRDARVERIASALRARWPQTADELIKRAFAARGLDSKVFNRVQGGERKQGHEERKRRKKRAQPARKVS